MSKASGKVIPKLVIIQPVPRKINGKEILHTFGPACSVLPKYLPYPEGASPEDKKAFQLQWAEIYIPAVGRMLDLNKEYDDIYLKIIKGNDDLNNLFQPGPGQRFKFVDSEMDAETYLISLENKMSMIATIQNLKETGEDGAIIQAGRALGLAGSPNVILVQMFKNCEIESELIKMSEYFMSPDREVLDVIHVALENGDRETKKGLYKAANGIFKYNNITIGATMEEVVLWLKNDENIGAYLELKKLIAVPDNEGEEEPKSAEPEANEQPKVDGRKKKKK